MKEDKYTLSQRSIWAKQYRCEILDYDGFDRSDRNMMNNMLTRDEFEKGLFMCTVMSHRDFRNDWKNFIPNQPNND